MFLELHLTNVDEKIMVNVNRIKSIYTQKGGTYIYMGEVVYPVKESYEDIIKAMQNYSQLMDA